MGGCSFWLVSGSDYNAPHNYLRARIARAGEPVCSEHVGQIAFSAILFLLQSLRKQHHFLADDLFRTMKRRTFNGPKPRKAEVDCLKNQNEVRQIHVHADCPALLQAAE